MAETLGREGKLYYGDILLSATKAFTDVSWTEVTKARDVTLNMDASEADFTSRGDGGWKVTAQALRDASIEFDLIWDEVAAQVEVLRNAYVTGGKISLAILSGDSAVSESEGLVSNFVITAFSRPEPLEGAMISSVTAKPAGRTEWYEVP